MIKIAASVNALFIAACHALYSNSLKFIGSSAPHAAKRTPILSTYYLWCTASEHPGHLTQFLVYINDLPTAVNHCSVSLYADDTVLYCYSGSNIKDLENINALNEDLSRIAATAESKQAYS